MTFILVRREKRVAVSATSQKTAHIIQQVRRGELSTSQAIESLMELALQSNTDRDLQFVKIARQAIEELDEKLGNKQEAAIG